MPSESCVEEVTKAWLDHITETLRNEISAAIRSQHGKGAIDDLYGLLSYREMAWLHHGLVSLTTTEVDADKGLYPPGWKTTGDGLKRAPSTHLPDGWRC
jgi:hypothetical protein